MAYDVQGETEIENRFKKKQITMNQRVSTTTQIGKVIKKITGIKDLSLFRKEVHKLFGKIIYHKKYVTSDIIDIMKSMGMRKGSVICIHSSMKEFYNYKGSARELIDAILETITDEGTIIMPAFPDPNISQKNGYIFDTIKDRTAAGYLAETFRQYPNVMRSNNIQHSVCAWGKYAEWLTKDHDKGHDCWDENSPWQKMLSLNALVFNLGLPRSYIGTFHHCVESILRTEHPYWAQFFNSKCKYRYYGNNRNIVEYEAWTCKLDRRTKERKITKYFTSEDWRINKISNLEIKVFYTEKCFPKMLNLGRKGISVYYVPSPKAYNFG